MWTRPLRCWAECSTPISASWKAGWKSRKNGISPRHEVIGDLSETTFGVSGRYPKKSGEGRKKICALSPSGKNCQEGKGWLFTVLRLGGHEPAPEWTRGLACGHEEEKEKKGGSKEKRAEDPVQKAQGSTAKLKLNRPTPARSGDALKVSARDGQSYADILKEMKAKVDPRKVGLEVLSIRRTRKEEVLPVLKKGGDVSAFRKQLDQAVGERAEISALVSTRSIEIRDLHETVEKEKVVSLPCAWHWAVRHLAGPAGSLPALVGWRPQWSGCQRQKPRVCFSYVKLGSGGLPAASESMPRSPDASGALATAMGPGAAATPTGRMPVGDAVRRDTWPRAARQRRGA